MEREIEEWLGKVNRKESDLSKEEDLSIGIMNLISLEEHFFFTAMKTQNQKYIDMLNSVRSLRKNLLKKIVIQPEGEEWCISKHLLAASMRLMEVGTKELSKNNVKEANMFFQSAFDLYSLFFAINMKIIDKEKLKQSVEENKSIGIMQKFSNIIKKIIDCCKE